MKHHLPNAITLINLFCGCAALVNILYGQFLPAFWFFFAGLTADYADGAVARRLGVQSSLGKQLDSLADVVSFGVVPGAIFYVLLVKGWQDGDLPQRVTPAALPAFLVSVFAGLRLGKFNIDQRQTDVFLGLPTPSATLFTVGLMLVHYFDSFGLGQWVTTPAFVYACILMLSGLMISELPMFNLKFKSFRWSGNEIKFIFTGVAIALLFLVREASLSLIILLYILISITQGLLKRP